MKNSELWLLGPNDRPPNPDVPDPPDSEDPEKPDDPDDVPDVPGTEPPPVPIRDPLPIDSPKGPMIAGYQRAFLMS